MAKPFLSLLRRLQNFNSSGLPRRKLLLACLLAAASARLVLGMAQQVDTTGRDIVGAWDFTGWSDQDKKDRLAILMPSFEDWAKNAS